MMGKEFGIQNSEFRMPARTFQDSAAWQNAHKFVLAVHAYTATFPRAETFGLTSQFRRASVSIPANIAEGFRRRGRADKARFLNIAQASIEECRYYVILETSKVLNSYAKAILNSDC